MLKKWTLVISSMIVICIISCGSGKEEVPEPEPPNPPNPIVFAKGADISWISEMEDLGIKFYNVGGTEQDIMLIMKNLGMNSIRLRVWVNPAAGYNNLADVTEKALRAKALGLRIMIDFHYSDTWADPGHQTKPVAWASQDINGLVASVSSHTADVMNGLKDAGIVPEWVQVGNETNDGMLWPEGKASTNMANFTRLVNAGYDAVKQVSPTSKVIVHLSNGYDNNLYRWIFDGLKANAGKWDIIGMSLYPVPTGWATYTDQCLTTMNDMVARYGSPVMVVEVGMSWDQPAACKAFLRDIISKTKAVNGNKGLGVFYWEPESYNNFSGYTLGAFDNQGRPTIAMDAFN